MKERGSGPFQIGLGSNGFVHTTNRSLKNTVT